MVIRFQPFYTALSIKACTVYTVDNNTQIHTHGKFSFFHLSWLAFEMWEKAVLVIWVLDSMCCMSDPMQLCPFVCARVVTLWYYLCFVWTLRMLHTGRPLVSHCLLLADLILIFVSPCIRTAAGSNSRPLLLKESPSRFVKMPSDIHFPLPRSIHSGAACLKPRMILASFSNCVISTTQVGMHSIVACWHRSHINIWY